ncbi:MAG: hypothetical protein RID09_20360 [Coleofasciculus sp. G1-WW12-02]|uniref:hypothetical protein n=1 Tax=Coleofasciculus sp. G1-WW12-02 TaxID=3068483 RepID=UPI003301812A
MINYPYPPRIPTRHQLDVISRLTLPTLEEFESRWSVSRRQLSYICHCSLATVNNWYVSGDCHREPGINHRIWLAIADKVWSGQKVIDYTDL